MKSKRPVDPDKKKQQLSKEGNKISVSKTSSQKSRREELADKSEGFGGSPEELDERGEDRSKNE